MQIKKNECEDFYAWYLTSVTSYMLKQKTDINIVL